MKCAKDVRKCMCGNTEKEAKIAGKIFIVSRNLNSAM
jgi:hypothetical protein